MNGSVMTASVAAAGGAQTGISGLANSETTYTSGSVTFSALGAITIRSTTGQQFQFSVNAQSVVPGIQTIAFANTTFTTGGVSFSNANGISFGSSGAQVTASYTVPTQSNQTLGIYASSNTTGASSSSTHDARSLTIQGLGGISAGWSNGSFQISGPALTSLSVTGALSASSNGSTISLGVGTVTVTATSNTTQASSGTINLNAMILNGAGGVSVGISNGSIVISGGAGGGGGPAISAAGNSVSNGTVVFSNSNGVSFGMNGSTITATVVPGAAAGIAAINNSNTTYTSGTIQLTEGGGAITIASNTGQRFAFSVPATSSLVGASGISISTAGSTISIYQPLLSYFANGLPYLANSQTQQMLQSTSVVFPMQVREGFSAGFVRMPHTVSVGSTSFASTAATAYSYQQAETHNIVLYSLGTGASSQSLQSIASKSVGFTMSVNVSQNTTNNISVTHGLTYGMSSNTSSLSFSYAATNSTMQVSTTHLSALTGVKMWDTQFALSLPPGRVFMAYGVSSSQTTQATNMSGARLQHSHLGVSQPNNTLGQFGIANAASDQWQQGIGSFSTAGGGTTASLALSNVSSSASHVAPYVQMINQA
jgi:hypothetical protein